MGFFLALTPREWWHTCNDHQEIEQTGQTHFEKDNCFVCDFDLGEIASPIIFSFYFSSFDQTFHLEDQPFSFNSTYLGLTLRGPPNFV